MNTKPTDNQLKQFLCEQLPEHITFYKNPQFPQLATWRVIKDGREIIDTELLAVCRMVEETLTLNHQQYFVLLLRAELARTFKGDLYQLSFDRRDFLVAHASWQQRATALMQVLQPAA